MKSGERADKLGGKNTAARGSGDKRGVGDMNERERETKKG